MKEFFNPSYIAAGFIAVLVGYTSSAVIIFQAAAAVGASDAQISSWMWALGCGMAATSIGLSVYFREPVLTAWSTPGAALLVTALNGVSLNEAIGVFIFSSTLIFICGITGWFDKVTRRIPKSLAGAMLAGVLLQFGLNVFEALPTDIVLVGVMVAGYLVLRQVLPRYAIPLVLLSGFLVAWLRNQIQVDALQLSLAQPLWITPEFSLQHLFGIGIPLFIVTMTSQNMPGLAVMRANNYQTPASPLITITGLCGIILAPFGGFAFNLAAITAAICMGKEAGNNPKTRYLASVWAGVFYLVTGLLGATVVSLFAAFPQALIAAIAGLALLGVIGNSLAGALDNPEEREAALITFLVSASGISLAGIGSAFWGLVLGLFTFYLPSWILFVRKIAR